jgi:predicted phage terminase large subunit-like protein
VATKDEALREQAKRELQKRQARASFEAFCGRTDEGYISAKHTRAVVSHLEALERKEIQRLAIFMPPRHSKSFHASERFPAWFLGRNPRAKIIVGCHTQRLADKKSRIIRRLIRDPRWPFEARLADDSTAVQAWALDSGGELTAAGVGTAIAGIGADLLVIDDPVAGRAEADSLVMRDAAWEWYTDDARTRLQPNGREVFMVTRWHEDDLAGRILNGPTANTWTVLSLPEYALANDPLGRAEGEMLWPGWLTAEFIAEQKELLGGRGFEAMYQQNPQPDAGLTFRREWFDKTYDHPPTSTRTIVVVDGAWKTGVAADRSALAHWGTDRVNYWPLDVDAGRWEYPDLRRHLLDFCARTNPNKVIIEDAASGTALIAELKRDTSLPVVGVKPIVSKIARVEAVTPLFESGRVIVPKSASWKEDWVSEHLRFPAGTHDDLVDTTAMALADLGLRAKVALAIAI